MAPIVALPAIEPTIAGRKSTTISKPAAEANTIRPSRRGSGKPSSSTKDDEARRIRGQYRQAARACAVLAAVMRQRWRW
jgi:hypothetical protein